MSNKGYLIINLHAHLPFINHIDKNYIEENWFFEAVVESYVPFIRMIENLQKDNIKPSITLSLSPTLGAMLENENLEKKLKIYINSRLELIEKEFSRENDERIHKILKVYQNLYEQAAEMVVRYSGDLITPLKRFQASGDIEIITTSATHSILPLLIHKEAIDAQITMAVEDYKDRFNKAPLGFWLPECAYDSRIPDFLKINDLKYFFLEDNSVDLNSENEILSHYKVSNGLNVFLRDSNSSMQVWSSQFGYPGNGEYREFYRDIGYDREIEYLKEFTGSDLRIPTGLKYYRVTSLNTELSSKEYYDYEKALIRAESDARDFLGRIISRFDSYNNLKSKPLIVNCYDAELFGHWWFEGHIFLENIIRIIRKDRIPVQIITPSEYIAISQSPQFISPQLSSWGEGGYFDPWLNESNDFIQEKIYEATEKMINLANRFKNQDLSLLYKRALNQSAREVLLLHSSDWPFLIYLGSHREYAIKRFYSHLENFEKLIKGVIDKNIDEQLLINLEKQNNIFPRINFKIFSSKSNI